jgi:hypothetical protein
VENITAEYKIIRSVDYRLQNGLINLSIYRLSKESKTLLSNKKALSSDRALKDFATD